MRFLLVLLALFLTLPTNALAKTLLITPNKAEADDVVVSAGDIVKVHLQVGKSYECSITQKAVDSANEFLTFDLEALDPDGESITLTGLGNITPVIATPSGASSLKSRIGITPTKTGIHTLTPENSSGTDDAATIRCTETTLYGGFNTFFAQIPIVEISNTTETEITANVSATDFNGDTIVEDVEVVIQPNSRTDEILDSISPSLYGEITVTAVAPAGALRATVAEYNFSGGVLVLRRERPMSIRPLLP